MRKPHVSPTRKHLGWLPNAAHQIHTGSAALRWRVMKATWKESHHLTTETQLAASHLLSFPKGLGFRKGIPYIIPIVILRSPTILPETALKGNQ